MAGQQCWCRSPRGSGVAEGDILPRQTTTGYCARESAPSHPRAGWGADRSARERATDGATEARRRGRKWQAGARRDRASGRHHCRPTGATEDGHERHTRQGGRGARADGSGYCSPPPRSEGGRGRQVSDRAGRTDTPARPQDRRATHRPQRGHVAACADDGRGQKARSRAGTKKPFVPARRLARA